MTNRIVAGGALIAAVALGASAVAQTQKTVDRFTFVAAKAREAGATAPDRLELRTQRWATDAERARLVSAFKTEGVAGVASAVREMPEAGYLDWPSYVQYVVRYAHRAPASDGGEDIVLAIERPIWIWWDKALNIDSAPFTVIQLHLDKDGRGEGKVSSGANITVGNEATGIVLQDPAKLPTLLADVQRAKNNT